MDIFLKKKIAGASVFRGMAGYGSHGVFHTAKMLELSTDLPVRIEVVDSEEMINGVMPDVLATVEKGLIEVSDTNVVKCCVKGK
jgi:PII-like signaling protein